MTQTKYPQLAFESEFKTLVTEAKVPKPCSGSWRGVREEEGEVYCGGGLWGDMGVVD